MVLSIGSSIKSKTLGSTNGARNDASTFASNDDGVKRMVSAKVVVAD